MMLKGKIIEIFRSAHALISLNVNIIGNPEDLRDGVGDIFARKMMQIANIETVFESELI